MAPPRERHRRKGGPRSRVGCKTCRIRHVKCDETTPNCRRCTDTGRSCDGQHLVLSDADKPRQVHVFHIWSPVHLSRRDHDSKSAGIYISAESFEMFHRAARSLGGIFVSEQWTDALLRLARERNELRHGILAVGALHSSETRSDREWAAQNYSVAVRCLAEGDQTLTADSFGATLSSWILCSVFELMLRNIGKAICHARRAIRTVTQHPALLHDEAGVSIPIKPLLGTLGNLETALCRMTGHIPQLTILQAQRDAFLAPFPSIEKARNDLQLIWHGLGVLNHHVSRLGTPMSSKSYSSFLGSHRELASALERWKLAFDDLVMRTGLDEEAKYAVAVLRIQYESAMQYASGLIEAQEMHWDQLYSQFERILDLADEIIATDTRPLSKLSPRCTLDYGIVSALFYVAWKCRHASLRLRAIELLENHPRIETLWDSALCARLVRFIDKVERGTAQLQDAAVRGDPASVISENSRVVSISLVISTGQRTAKIALMTTSTMADGLPHYKEEAWNW